MDHRGTVQSPTKVTGKGSHPPALTKPVFSHFPPSNPIRVKTSITHKPRALSHSLITPWESWGGFLPEVTSYCWGLEHSRIQKLWVQVLWSRGQKKKRKWDFFPSKSSDYSPAGDEYQLGLSVPEHRHGTMMSNADSYTLVPSMHVWLLLRPWMQGDMEQCQQPGIMCHLQK